MSCSEQIVKLENKYSINNYYGNNTQCNVIKYGNTPILISAPHSIKQKRNGVIKSHEFYTGAIAEYLAHKLCCSVITKQELDINKYNDDANYEDTNCNYKRTVKDFLEHNDISLFIDIHGLSGNKDSIIDICTNNGLNVNEAEYWLIDSLVSLIQNKFIDGNVSVNKYFKADKQYILSMWVHDTFDISAIQLEINGRYRWFDGDTKIQSELLVSILYQWLSNYKK